MNPQMPFFNPINNYPSNIFMEIEKLSNKIDLINKNLQILEKKVQNLENTKQDNNKFYSDDPTDMYII